MKGNIYLMKKFLAVVFKIIVDRKNLMNFCHSDLRTNRNKLLEHLTDPNHTVETMEKTANEYFSLLQGLYMEIDSKEPENKLRKVLAFRWTNTLLGNNAV